MLGDPYRQFITGNYADLLKFNVNDRKEIISTADTTVYKNSTNYYPLENLNNTPLILSRIYEALRTKTYSPIFIAKISSII